MIHRCASVCTSTAHGRIGCAGCNNVETCRDSGPGPPKKGIQEHNSKRGKETLPHKSSSRESTSRGGKS